MARRRWTFGTRAGGEPSPRQFRLPREAVGLSIALALLFAAGVGSTLTGVPVSWGAPGAGSELARSSFLRSEFRSLKGFAPGAGRTPVALLERRDRAFRLLAGLQAADTVVPEDLPLWSPDGAAARRAYDSPVDFGSVVQRARRVSFTWREAEDSVVEYRDRLASTPSIVPAIGYISSGFSRARMHPILALRRPHRGLDIVARYGSPIVASARGRVSFVGYEGEYGLTIEIDHGRGVKTRYAHASRALVRPGQLVTRGDTIARVGRSGLADGPHVHYEVLVNGEPRNPRYYIFSPNIIP